VILSTKIKKVITNSSWMIGQNIYFMIIGVFVTAVVARYFGPDNYGKFNYVVATVSLFTAVSTLGMETLTVKAIVDKKYEEGTVLFTSLILSIAGSVLLIFSSNISIYFLSKGNTLFLQMCFLYSLALSMNTLGIFEYWAQAKMALKFVSVAKMISFTIISLLKLSVVYYKGSLLAYTFLFLIDAMISGTAIVLFYYFNRDDKTKWKFNVNLAKEILLKCWPIAISGLMVTIYMKIDQVMLGTMIASKVEVGIYSAAANVAAMWYFVPTAIITSFKPIVMKYKADGSILRYSSTTKLLYSIVTWTGIGFGILISISAPLIIKILYGSAFIKAASVLTISVWAGTFALLGSARSIWLVCENLQKYTMVYSLAGCITNVILNFILIPKYGAYGAAFATLVSQASNIFILLFFNDTRNNTVDILKSFNPIYIISAIKKHSLKTERR
jgi:O-antigen/teichoic acid export membrane protein